MVKIEKIVLKVGGKTLELSPEEVKELKEVLDKMFGDEKVVHHYWPNYPYYYPTYPTYTPSWTYSAGDVTLLSGTTTDTVRY